MLDVFYLTYNGDYSQKNFDRIVELSDGENRITNVADIDGIYAAHKRCAEMSMTENFFVIDGDAYLLDGFNIGYDPSNAKDVYPGVPATQCTHVWRARNPYTDKVYGYGGVKMFNVGAFDSDDDDVVDMTTTVAKRGFPYYAVKQVSNITQFNNSPFNAWKGAFRECAKLASGGMEWGDVEKLNEWKTRNYHADFYEQVHTGVLMGEKYGREHRDDREAMKKINDFEWLKLCFDSMVNI
jgi:hypothetical protein